MKFSVGDRVRVVSHSQADRVMDEGRSAFVPAMIAFTASAIALATAFAVTAAALAAARAA